MKNSIIEKFMPAIQNLLSSIKVNDYKSQLVKDGIGSLLINVSNKALMLVTGVILVRVLGKDSFGIYSFILSLIIVLIVPIEFGVSNLIVRETAIGLSKNQPEKVKGIWRWSLRLAMTISVSVLIILIISSLFVRDNFSELEILTFYWALGLIPLHSFIHLISAALRGMKFLILGQLPDLVIIPGLYTFLMLLFGFLLPIDFSLATAMALRVIVTFFAFLICIIFFIIKLPKKVLRADSEQNDKIWLASAIPLSLSSGINMVKGRITIIIIGFFVSASEIGTFQVAISAASIAGLVLQSANVILAPQFAALFANDEKNKLQKLLTSSSRVITAFSIFGTIIFIVWGRLLLKITFGPELIDAYLPTLVLIIGQLINSLVGSVAFLLNMTGNEKDVMKIISISTILNIILTLILSPLIGIIGAAISNSLTLIIAQFTMNKIAQKKLGLASHVFR
jgi:O-antigen/teichoic acid export membrane protein